MDKVVEKPVRLGQSDVWLSVPLGIGTMQWGTTWLDSKVNRGGNMSDAQVTQVFAKLVESKTAGFFDSAEGYGGGTSELRIHQVMAAVNPPPGSVILATKFMPLLWRWTEESFMRSLRGSLQRLGVQVCDIYFLHTPVHPLPLEFWVECAAKAANAGLIKAIGISNCNAEQVRRACSAAAKHGQKISANQILFSLLDYNAPDVQEVEKTCKELGVTLIAYSPVGQGLLTEGLDVEKLKSIRVARMKGLTLEDLSLLRSKISDIASTRKKTMAQVCLNWVICHGAIPLVGTRTVKHVEDNAGCLGWRLTPEEVKQLDSVALGMSTLKKPKWKRMFFVGLISTLILTYRVCITIESLLGH
mmetsp:Transcript_5980/g.10768  ORF Transcript_5980/g.10768 Transcript_5980/m.10768 type:complete len:358 (+) Transcript_5980:171-1244(+)